MLRPFLRNFRLLSPHYAVIRSPSFSDPKMCGLERPLNMIQGVLYWLWSRYVRVKKFAVFSVLWAFLGGHRGHIGPHIFDPSFSSSPLFPLNYALYRTQIRPRTTEIRLAGFWRRQRLSPFRSNSFHYKSLEISININTPFRDLLEPTWVRPKLTLPHLLDSSIGYIRRPRRQFVSQQVFLEDLCESSSGLPPGDSNRVVWILLPPRIPRRSFSENRTATTLIHFRWIGSYLPNQFESNPGRTSSTPSFSSQIRVHPVLEVSVIHRSTGPTNPPWEIPPLSALEAALPMVYEM